MLSFWLAALLVYTLNHTETVAAAVCCVASVVSDSVRPRLTEQPTRLPSPWDSPGKNTGVGCHFLLQRDCLGQVNGLKHSVTSVRNT